MSFMSKELQASPRFEKAYQGSFLSIFYIDPQTHADDSVILTTPAQSPVHLPLSQHSRSGSTASADVSAAASPYSMASLPLSSNSSQGFYSPDSHFAQIAYDGTLSSGNQWNVGAGGYVETVNPQNTSRKRSYEAVNDFFEDVKRHKIQPVYDDSTSLFPQSY